MRRFLLAAVVSLAALLFMEVVVRSVLPRPGFQPFPPIQPEGLLLPHVARGYSYAPAFTGSITTPEYQVELSINSLGLRDGPLAAGEPIEILAVGDSFTVGSGVEAEEAWPAQLESYLAAQTQRDLRVLNAGVSGYNLEQIRLLTEELLYLEPELVVLGLYPSRYWRLESPYSYFEGYAVERSKIPHLELTDGGFLHSGFESGWVRELHHRLMKNFYLGARALEVVELASRKLWQAPVGDSPEPLSIRQRLQPLLAELRKTNKLCQGRGARLVIVLVNNQETDGSFASIEAEYNAILKSFGKRRGIAVFDPLPHFEASSSGDPVFRIGNDHHWSARAHELVGRELARFLLEKD